MCVLTKSPSEAYPMKILCAVCSGKRFRLDCVGGGGGNKDPHGSTLATSASGSREEKEYRLS